MMHPNVEGHNVFKQMSCKDQDKFYSVVKDIATCHLVEDAPEHVEIKVKARAIFNDTYIYIDLNVNGMRLAITRLKQEDIPCFDISRIKKIKILEVNYEENKSSINI